MMLNKKRKGKMIYVTPSLLNETDIIMRNKGYKRRSKALNDLAKYAKVGMEAEMLYKLDFGIFKRKRKKK